MFCSLCISSISLSRYLVYKTKRYGDNAENGKYYYNFFHFFNSSVFDN